MRDDNKTWRELSAAAVSAVSVTPPPASSPTPEISDIIADTADIIGDF